LWEQELQLDERVQVARRDGRMFPSGGWGRRPKGDAPRSAGGTGRAPIILPVSLLPRLGGESWLGAGPRFRGAVDGMSVPCAPTEDGGGKTDPPHKGGGAGVAAPPPQVIP